MLLHFVLEVYTKCLVGPVSLFTRPVGITIHQSAQIVNLLAIMVSFTQFTIHDVLNIKTYALSLVR